MSVCAHKWTQSISQTPPNPTFTPPLGLRLTKFAARYMHIFLTASYILMIHIDEIVYNTARSWPFMNQTYTMDNCSYFMYAYDYKIYQYIFCDH